MHFTNSADRLERESWRRKLDPLQMWADDLLPMVAANLGGWKEAVRNWAETAEPCLIERGPTAWANPLLAPHFARCSGGVSTPHSEGVIPLLDGDVKELSRIAIQSDLDAIAIMSAIHDNYAGEDAQINPWLGLNFGRDDYCELREREEECEEYIRDLPEMDIREHIMAQKYLSLVNRRVPEIRDHLITFRMDWTNAMHQLSQFMLIAEKLNEDAHVAD